MFRFEVYDVPTPTVDSVRQAVEARLTCWVEGDLGCGKTYAVRKAVPEAVWVDLDDGPLQVPRFFVQIARQLNGGANDATGGNGRAPQELGRAILQEACAGTLDQALAVAKQALDGRCLVVDRAEPLGAPQEWSWEDPRALWLADRSKLIGWLRDGRSCASTVLIGRRTPRDWCGERIQHQRLTSWSVKLTFSGEGFARWRDFADDCVDLRPGGLVLGLAVLLLLGPNEFNNFVDQLMWDKSRPEESIARLGETIRSRAPQGWQRALALIDVLGHAPRAAVVAALEVDGDVTVSTLEKLGLVQSAGGDRLAIVNVVRAAGALSGLPDKVRMDLFQRAAAALLKEVNDYRSLRPEDAERVLQAHALYVAIGDDENARRTARLHVSGLVDLARRTSLAEQWDAARRQYEAIRSMMAAFPGRAGDQSWEMTRSYVSHYRGYNGSRAGTVPDGQTLSDYEEAVGLWRENALWQSRCIALLVRLGRFQEAESCIRAAYDAVRDHPRRDGYLRIGPAGFAMIQGAFVFALRLLEPVIDLTPDVDPEGAELLQKSLRKWENGVEVAELEHPAGRLAFRAVPRITLCRLSNGWRAGLADLSMTAQAKTPTAALAELAGQVVHETERLVRTPSHCLSEDDLRRKGRFLGRVDVLNSDLGLEHATHRWFLGRIVDGEFVPTQPGYGHVPVSAARNSPDERTPAGLFFALVPVYRDGSPAGPVTSLLAAGSGRSFLELLAVLRELPDPEDAARAQS